MRVLISAASILGAILFSGCASGPGGTVTTPVATTAAQTVGSDQGTAQATESSSTSVTITPSVINLLGVQRATVTRNADGSEVIEVEGAPASSVVISAAANMGVTIGSESARAESSSGGGAAGGTGGSVRQAEASGTQGIAPAVPGGQ